ncbi:hypothetical protein [Paenibacillus oceani]|uniref:Uncharacterized protein n=1 Tax=Paenibacillus oceani TaxID=2772510 RepID=A0A927C7S0_9BACL|nr:hypothetical protein [Paenibacillus oceani]MBD2860920.1 hypothetical protein [Paenibacillus oceani]
MPGEKEQEVRAKAERLRSTVYDSLRHDLGRLVQRPAREYRDTAENCAPAPLPAAERQRPAPDRTDDSDDSEWLSGIRVKPDTMRVLDEFVQMNAAATTAEAAAMLIQLGLKTAGDLLASYSRHRDELTRIRSQLAELLRGSDVSSGADYNE